MSENNAPENVEGGQWWSRPVFVVCASLVALGIILAIVLPLWPDGGDDSASAEPSPTAAPDAPSQDAGDSDSESVCGLDASDDTTLTSAPDAEWGSSVGGIMLPSSEDHGPGVHDESNDVRSCFSHSPEGAVLAATNLVGASGDPDVLAETIEQRSVDSTGKDVALEQAANGGGGAPPIQVAGFRLLNYSEDQATVEVVVEVQGGGDSTLLTTGADLVWTNGDWYATYDDDGSGGPVAGEVSNLSGYTTWGPNDG